VSRGAPVRVFVATSVNGRAPPSHRERSCGAVPCLAVMHQHTAAPLGLEQVRHVVRPFERPEAPASRRSPAPAPTSRLHSSLRSRAGLGWRRIRGRYRAAHTPRAPRPDIRGRHRQCPASVHPLDASTRRCAPIHHGNMAALAERLAGRGDHRRLTAGRAPTEIPVVPGRVGRQELLLVEIIEQPLGASSISHRRSSRSGSSGVLLRPPLLGRRDAVPRHLVL